jgi:hypothetical protein
MLLSSYALELMHVGGETTASRLLANGEGRGYAATPANFRMAPTLYVTRRGPIFSGFGS